MVQTPSCLFCKKHFKKWVHIRCHRAKLSHMMFPLLGKPFLLLHFHPSERSSSPQKTLDPLKVYPLWLLKFCAFKMKKWLIQK